MAKTKEELLLETIQVIKDNGGNDPNKTKGVELRELIADLIEAVVQVDDFAEAIAGKQNVLVDVLDSAERLALTGVLKGDVVREISTGCYYIFVGGSIDSEANWRQSILLKKNALQVTPSANAATVDFVANEVGYAELNCTTQTSNVSLTINAYKSFAQVIRVVFGATPISLNISGVVKQAGGGSALITGDANATMLLTVFFDGTSLYVSPQVYA